MEKKEITIVLVSFLLIASGTFLLFSTTAFSSTSYNEKYTNQQFVSLPMVQGDQSIKELRQTAGNGKYIVILEKTTDRNIISNYGSIEYNFKNFNGAIAKMNANNANKLKKAQGVKLVEADQEINIGPSTTEIRDQQIRKSRLRDKFTILNDQSYPKVGKQWTIKMETRGIGTLTVEPINGTAWGDKNNGNIQIVELSCGGKIQKYSFTKNKITINNYNCQKTTQVTNKILQKGKHTLKITYSGTTKFAYNDTNQWNLGAEGLNAEAAWQTMGGITPGTVDSREKIAIIDSGVNYTLADLNGAKYAGGIDYCVTGTGTSCTGEDNDPMDIYGHGTEMATAMLSTGNIIYGVAPQAQYYAIKITNDNSRSSNTVLLKAIDWAISRNDVNIIFMGISSAGTNFLPAVFDSNFINGKVFIAPTYMPRYQAPASYGSVIGAGGYLKTFEPLTENGAFTSVTAPGELIPVLTLDGTTSTATDNLGAAAAQITGLFALMKLSKKPNNNIDFNSPFFWQTIEQSATITAGFPDKNQGRGRVDANKAISLIDKNWYIAYSIGYMNPPGGYDAQGYPVYYMGRPMDFNVTITNNSGKTITDLNIRTKEYYYDGAMVGTPVVGMPVFETKIVSIAPNESITIGPYRIDVPTNMQAGLDNTELTIIKEHPTKYIYPGSIPELPEKQVATIKLDPYAGIYCPPENTNPTTETTTAQTEITKTDNKGTETTTIAQTKITKTTTKKQATQKKRKLGFKIQKAK